MNATADLSVSVRVSTGWSAPGPDGSDRSGGAHPSGWLGAPATAGLALPAADPTAAQMYSPRGVWLDDERVIVADTGNHRVLIWNSSSPDLHADADIVLGQPDFFTEGAQAGGRGPERGMRLPTGVIVHDGRLIVADAWNHRILIWNQLPAESDVAPDLILGQANNTDVAENRGGPCAPNGFYWPFGVAVIAGGLWVADTGNRRVLSWSTVPESPDTAPDVVLGQPDAESRDENRGEVGPRSFRWPHDIAGNADGFFVADAGNHRLLRWDTPPTSDVDADGVFGQHDFIEHGEFPYQPQTAASLRFPYAISIEPQVDTPGMPPMMPAMMTVADTANNRILVWDTVPTAPQTPADRVLGQPDFGTNGENRWDAVGPDTFCWPYGLCAHGGRVAVADSGNNRVTIWNLR